MKKGEQGILDNLGINELREINQFIQNKLIKPTSKNPICSQCGSEFTNEIWTGEGRFLECRRCNNKILVNKSEKEIPQKNNPLPLCKECHSEPATITIFSNRVNGTRICAGCSNLQKYMGS
jgi:DNA-directed RNA polymerase subunit RPC12/RpoP